MPEWMVPDVAALTVDPAPLKIAVARLIAWTPEEPELMTVPAAVVIDTLPVLLLEAVIPNMSLATILPAWSLTVTSPGPKLYARIPSPPAAWMSAKLSTVTVPNAVEFAVLVVPPLYPARIPAGRAPPPVYVMPELMVPLAVTAIVLTVTPPTCGIDVAWL